MDRATTGTIQAAIIGVGGFLGMGEKDVAVPLNQITAARDENNAVKLTITASREDLDKAPAFDKTLFLVKTPKPDTTLPVQAGQPRHRNRIHYGPAGSGSPDFSTEGVRQSGLYRVVSRVFQ